MPKPETREPREPRAAPIDYTTNEHLRRNKRFSRAMMRAAEVREEMATLDAELEALKSEEIEPELVAAGVGNATVDFRGWKVRIADVADSPRLDKRKLVKVLLDEGVEADMLQNAFAEASTETAPKHYVEIRSPRDAQDTLEEQMAKEVVRVLSAKPKSMIPRGVR